jgi:hypothetical protein
LVVCKTLAEVGIKIPFSKKYRSWSRQEYYVYVSLISRVICQAPVKQIYVPFQFTKHMQASNKRFFDSKIILAFPCAT